MKNRLVDYVAQHPYLWLFHYHRQVMGEITQRRIATITPVWWEPTHRGPQLGTDPTVLAVSDFTACGKTGYGRSVSGNTISGPTVCGIAVSDYPEHDAAYLAECLENLRRKGHTLPPLEVE